MFKTVFPSQPINKDEISIAKNVQTKSALLLNEIILKLRHQESQKFLACDSGIMLHVTQKSTISQLFRFKLKNAIKGNISSPISVLMFKKNKNHNRISIFFGSNK